MYYVRYRWYTGAYNYIGILVYAVYMLIVDSNIGCEWAIALARLMINHGLWSDADAAPTSLPIQFLKANRNLVVAGI